MLELVLNKFFDHHFFNIFPRAMHLLQSGLKLGSQQLQQGQLKPSNTVKSGKLNFSYL